MHVIVIKYIQLFCISVFLNEKKFCNEIFGPNHDQQQLYQISECLARCINIKNQTLLSCYPGCSEKNESIKDVDLKYSKAAYLKLICRDSTKMVVKVLQNESYDSINTNTTLDTLKQIYLVKIQEDEQTNREHIVYLSDTPFFTIENLKNNSTFNISGIIINSKGEKTVTSMQQMKTLPSYYKPEKIKDLKIKKKFNNATQQVDVTINWEPGNDRTCFYDIVYHSSEDGDFPLVSIPIRDPSVLYEYVIKNLTINHDYTVGIRSLNTINKTRESDFFWQDFNTSRCNAFHNLNLTICPPDAVSYLIGNLTKNETNGSNYLLKVHWSEPLIVPDIYTVEVIDRSTHEILKAFVVSGNETTLSTELELKRPKYGIILNIYSTSPGGKSKPFHTEIYPDFILKEVIHVKIWQLFLLIFLIALLLTIIGVFIHNYRKRKNIITTSRENQASKENGGDYLLTNQCDKEISYWYSQFIINDELEVSKSNVEILEKLGEGAFGMVNKGILRCNDKVSQVAIKTLKENPTKSEIEDFRHEIELMKSVGKHKNIVGILGHYTKNYKDMMLLIEYCGKGNLLNFLRKTWKYMQKNSNQNPVGQCFFNKMYGQIEDKPRTLDWDEGFVDNIGYELFECDNIGLFGSDGLILLYFALQVASGMEYLSNDKVVHRDLAARNVLVCDDLTLKISDFGLSRDVYQENFYRKTGDGKLPIKWLALESMTRQLYDMYTDVWSYGILLYEIFTLGNDPYPTIPTNKLLDALKFGYRMEKPYNCSDAVYNLMRSCWFENPNSRPSFTKIKAMLQSLMYEMKIEKIEHVSLIECYRSEVSSLISVESYLKPVV